MPHNEQTQRLQQLAAAASVHWEDYLWNSNYSMHTELHINTLKSTYAKSKPQKKWRRRTKTLIKSSPARFYLNPEARWVSGQHHHDY